MRWSIASDWAYLILRVAFWCYMAWWVSRWMHKVDRAADRILQEESCPRE